MLSRSFFRTRSSIPKNIHTLSRPIPSSCRPSLLNAFPSQAKRLNSNRGYPDPRQSPRGPGGSRYQQSRFDPEAARRARPFFENHRPGPYKAIGVVLAGGSVIFYFSHREDVPVSGRTRFICYSDESVEQEGKRMYEQVMQDNRNAILPSYDRRAQMVQRVMQRLIPASGMENVDWEIHVIESNEMNAFVIPGGKVFVFSGILRVAQDDDGLAVILGHEIAHNLARHSNEQMSRAVILEIPRLLFLGLDYSGYTAGFGRIIGDLLLDFGMMRPASRKQESEADYIGLMMMAKACYDPRAAADVWERMETANANGIPTWLSTHPTNTSRMENMRAWFPKAQAAREESGCAATYKQFNGFKDTFGGVLTGWGGFGDMSRNNNS